MPDKDAVIKVGHIPEGHFIVGSLVSLKCLDEDGKVYWALRASGLNDMEALGMAHDTMVSCERDIQEGKKRFYPRGDR